LSCVEILLQKAGKERFLNPWPTIPKDAIEYFRGAFAEANRIAAERIVNVPNIRETSLDDAIVDALVPFSPPKRLRSGAIVEMDIHNIGGLKRVYRWETADIAIVVFVYRGKRMLAQKIGMLQTKRLFPKNNDVLDDDPEGFGYGMNAFLNRDSRSPLAVLTRTFAFDNTCIYGSLKAGTQQVVTIERLNDNFGNSVFYMFYNPSTIPIAISYPVRSKRHITNVKLGCRVFDSREVHAVLSKLQKDHSPTLKMIVEGTPKSNWRLEQWVADLVLTCKVGQRFDESTQETVANLLERRSGPIGAAIAVSIALPND
jgi:hypothetical protein